MNETLVTIIAIIGCSASIYLLYISIRDIVYWNKKKKFYDELLIAIHNNDFVKIKECLNSKYLDSQDIKEKLIRNIQLFEELEEKNKQQLNSLN